MRDARTTPSGNISPTPGFRFGPFDFDPTSGLLYQGDEETLLPPRVAAVLLCLLERSGQLVTKDELLESAWQDASVADSSISYTISILRQVLADDARSPTYIETLHGRGYRFVAAVGRPDSVGPPVDATRAADGPGAPGDRPGARGDETGRRGDGTDAQTTPAAASGERRGAPLAPGDRLGSYEIVDVVGAGATGTVYRARDDSLGRDVAIKLLADDLADDPQRLARLEREAKLLAALSHPNIATIHSLEEDDGRRIPILEFVDGETLDERIHTRPPNVPEALRIARDIASALEAAHERGIIHRDLKPANIKLTPQGQVKVLDFGLAKRLEVRALGEQIAATPTTSLTVRGRRGSIVGTAAYMSPEQARGLEVDRSADNWSFGCVLYELLTGGSRPFDGDTIADTLARVIGSEPDWTALPVGTPPAIRSLLRRCLHKEPSERLRDIGDARIEINDALAAPTEEFQSAAESDTRRLSRRAVAASLPLAFLTGVAADRLILDRFGEETPPSSPAPDDGNAFHVVAPDGLRVGQVAVSPDGREVVFVGRGDGRSRLYRRRLDEFHSEPIPGTEGAVNRAFFSPAGDRIGFFTRTELLTVAFPSGGDVRAVVEGIFGADTGVSASWGEDDVIVFGAVVEFLRSVHANGVAPPEPLTALDGKRELGHNLPRHVRGTSLLLFTARRGGWNHDIKSIDLDRPQQPPRIVTEDARNAHLLRSDRLVFERAGNLYSVAFDAGTGSTRGPAALVAENVWSGVDGVHAAPVAAAEETLAWMGQDQTYERHTIASWHPDRGLRFLSDSGTSAADLPNPPAYKSLRLSPDGERLLLVERVGPLEGRLMVSGVSQLNPTEIPTRGLPYAAIWHPEGGITYVARESERSRFAIYLTPADDGLKHPIRHQEVFASPQVLYPVSWDGAARRLVFNELDALENWRLRYYDVQTDQPHEAIPTSRSHQPGGDLSPDGSWIAFHDDIHGLSVAPFLGEDRPEPIGDFHAKLPRWATVDGELFLYYLEGEGFQALDRVRVHVGQDTVRFSEPASVLRPPDPARVDPTVSAYRLNAAAWPVFDIGPGGTIFVLLRHQGGRRRISVRAQPAAR